MPNFEDLVAVDLTIMLRAVAERLALIETDELERKCLLPRPSPDTKLYARLQTLLDVARRCSASTPQDRALAEAVEALRGVWLPGDVDPAKQHPDGDPGDIVALGRTHALVTRRLAELQLLYQKRLEVTRRAIEMAQARHDSSSES